MTTARQNLIGRLLVSAVADGLAILVPILLYDWKASVTVFLLLWAIRAHQRL